MTDAKLIIGGKHVEGDLSGEVINPATEQVVATVSRASLAQAEQAVQAAKSAFSGWAETLWVDRQAKLGELADALAENADEFARTLTMEQGKPLPESQFEVSYTEAFIRHFATLEIANEVVQDDDAFFVEVRRKPLGVVAAITPWNFPVLIPGFKIAMATLAGNSVVLKPSPNTPLTGLMLAALCNDIFPAGVVNAIVDDNDLGAYLSEHPDVAKVSFTGSVDTGKKVMSSASSTLKRITLELGGNDAGIVLPDVDVKETARKIFDAAFMNCGQVCLALKRAYVPEAIYDDMCDELARLANEAVVDDGMSQGATIGPLQNAAQYEKVKHFLRSAERDGRIIAGGEIMDRAGYFIRPTIVRDVSEGSEIVDDEQFGPVLPVISYAEDEDIIARANDSQFGLGGSVWSADEKRAIDLAGGVEAGTVWVNQHLYFAPHIPFAGAKNSGIGVEFAKEGLEEFSQIQVINVAH